MRPPAVLERCQDDVGGDRRPPERVDPHRVGDGIDDRAETCADRWLAHAPCADRRVWIGNTERRPLEPGRDVEDRQRLGVMESPAERQPVLWFVDELLAEGVRDPEAASTVDLPAET